MMGFSDENDLVSARRKDEEKRIVFEGQALWNQKKESDANRALEERSQLRKMLANYHPWGAPGHGAPIPGRLKKTKLILDEPNIAEQQLKFDSVLTMGRPGHGAPIRSPSSGRLRTLLTADPAIRFQFHEATRRCVDNTLRYKVSPNEKDAYRRQLDTLVREKRRFRQHSVKEALDDDKNKMEKTGPNVQEQLFTINNDGVELMPILLKHRSPVRRTLPTTDVTQYEKITNEFRQTPDTEAAYSRELESQVQSRKEMFERARQDDILRSIEHFNTWKTFWGRPGHGAPKGKILVKEKLDTLLYKPPPKGPIPVA